MNTQERGEPSPEQLEQQIELLYIEAGELREAHYEKMESWVQDIWDDVEIEAGIGLERTQAKDRLIELIGNVKRIVASTGTRSDETM